MSPNQIFTNHGVISCSQSILGPTSVEDRPAPILNRIALGCTNTRNTITVYHGDDVQRLTLAELDCRARRVAVGLRKLGLSRGDRIGLFARNCLEWILVDLAALKLGVVTAGFEFGRFPPRESLIEDYGLRYLFVNDDTVRPGFIDLKTIATLPDDGAELDVIATWYESDVATIKFTSGSTGNPKGLAATVGSIESSLDAVQLLFRHEAEDKLLVFLPLSLLQQRYWIYSALYFGHDITVTTYELAFYAVRKEKPTVIMGVPAFYDALRRQIEPLLGDELDIARRRACACTVIGDNIRYLWTGSAPANSATLSFFNSVGVPIYEGYGMNETCIVSKNHPKAHRMGSVGQVVPGKAVYFDPSGVIIVRSRSPVNARYLYCTEGESEAIFLPNGDVYTGDLGYFDSDGFLYITGRTDDVVTLTSGKNVPVRLIEDKVKTIGEIDHCVLYGAGRPYLVALLTLTQKGVPRDLIARHLDRVNTEHDAHERVERFIICDGGFSIENGLLTSQYKPRRKEIFKLYRSQIEQSYEVIG